MKGYCYKAGTLRWRVEVGKNCHVLVYYSKLGVADLFIHGEHHEVLHYAKDICFGMRNATNFARRIGAHLSISDFRSVGLTPKKPNVSKGRWDKR